MNFTKSLFFTALLFSANSFSMFKTARILRTLNQVNKTTLNKQNLLVQVQNNQRNYSQITKNSKWVHDAIRRDDPKGEIDPTEALKILNFYKKFNCNSTEQSILKCFLKSGIVSLKGNTAKTVSILDLFGKMDQMDDEVQKFFESRLEQEINIKNGE